VAEPGRVALRGAAGPPRPPAAMHSRGRRGGIGLWGGAPEPALKVLETLGCSCASVQAPEKAPLKSSFFLAVVAGVRRGQASEPNQRNRCNMVEATSGTARRVPTNHFNPHLLTPRPPPSPSPLSPESVGCRGPSPEALSGRGLAEMQIKSSKYRIV